MTLLEDTDASGIAAALLDARRSAGSPAMGMVLTMVIVVPGKDAEDALAAAREAAREHPSRLLGVVIGPSRGPSRITAEIRAGSGTSGEQALIGLSGEVTQHPESVVLPLLLPDSPVVVWWPSAAPTSPADDPIGRLGTRRITDASQVPTRKAHAMLEQCASYAPGNTDLAWTRITQWRALLATALDQSPGKVSRITLAGERISPSADLLGAWLADRLKAPVTWKKSAGPGITEATLTTRAGDIRICREDGRLATLTVPGQPDRPVALRRRTVPELLTEELRRLDPDDVYAATVRKLHRMHTASSRSGSTSGSRSGSASGAKTRSKPAPKSKG